MIAELEQRSTQRTSTDTVSVSLPSSLTFGYDLNGNLTNWNGRSFEYDDENQLTRVTESGQWKTEFTYDGKMRLRQRQEYGWSGSAWTLTNDVRYLYDGMLVIQERDASNIPVLSYTRGRDLSGSREGAGGIGGLLAQTDHRELTGSAAHAFYHADGNGNVTALVNTNQVIVARYSYDPYGNTLSMSGPKAEVNRYRFSSKEHHAKTGLYYYGYRFYVPELQRWLNRDPIGEGGGWNVYRFAKNAPPVVADIMGLDAVAVSGPFVFQNPVGTNVLVPFYPNSNAGHQNTMGPSGNTGSGNGITAGPSSFLQSCNTPFLKQITSKWDVTCPCSGVIVQCERGRQCVNVGSMPTAAVNTGLAPVWAWQPYESCESCPEGNYSI